MIHHMTSILHQNTDTYLRVTSSGFRPSYISTETSRHPLVPFSPSLSPVSKYEYTNQLSTSAACTSHRLSTAFTLTWYNTVPFTPSSRYKPQVFIGVTDSVTIIFKCGFKYLYRVRLSPSTRPYEATRPVFAFAESSRTISPGAREMRHVGYAIWTGDSSSLSVSRCPTSCVCNSDVLLSGPARGSTAVCTGRTR